MLVQVPRRVADHRKAARLQIFNSLLLRRVEVSRRDDARAPALERQQQRHGLGLEMDARADRLAGERPALAKLLRDRPQKPRVLANPLDTGFHLVSPSQERERSLTTSE